MHVGQEVAARSVFCPRTQSSKQVEECQGCERFFGFRDPSLPPEWLALLPRGDDADAATLVCEATAEPSTTERADDVPVSSVMTKRVFSVHESATVDAVSQLFALRGIHGVPVVDEAGHPVGVVTRRDLRDPTGDDVVGDIMTPFPYTVRESATLADAAELMLEKGVHRVPVLSADGAVVGILSAIDALRWLAGRHRAHHEEPELPADEEEPAPTSLRTMMLELLWVCGDCGAHYPHTRLCPEHCLNCGAPKAHFYAPIED